MPAISLPARPSSKQTGIDSALLDGCHQCAPAGHGSIRGFDQTTGQSAEAIPPSSSAPTLTPSGYPNSKSLFFASSATLLLLPQNLRCCIDRLNSRSLAGAPLVAFIATKPTLRVTVQRPVLTRQFANRYRPDLPVAVVRASQYGHVNAH